MKIEFVEKKDARYIYGSSKEKSIHDKEELQKKTELLKKVESVKEKGLTVSNVASILEKEDEWVRHQLLVGNLLYIFIEGVPFISTKSLKDAVVNDSLQELFLVQQKTRGKKDAGVVEERPL